MKLSSEELRPLFPEYKGNKEILFSTVYTDSRKKVKNGLFIPLVGERFNAHDFIEQAIKNGASAACWQKDQPVPKHLSDFPLFLVEDTLLALQQIAVRYLEKVAPIVIGVTGSNGKTTTKDMIESVLHKSFRTFKTQGNLNNHIGVPLTILSMPSDCQVLIAEMGMSGFGEISLLTRLAKPDYAVITNIGDSHLEQLKTRENIAKAKLEIAEGLKDGGYLILDGDEPLLEKEKSCDHVESCGEQTNNTYVITNVLNNEQGITFTLNETETYFIPYYGKHNVKNATYAIVIAKHLGLDTETIKKGLSSLTLTGMRFERIPSKTGALLINDAYNASPTSMQAAITTVKELTDYQAKVLVLGDMYELGTNEKAMHESVADAIDNSITAVITIGDKGRWIAEGLKEKAFPTVFSFAKKDDAIKTIRSFMTKGTVILFKASRGMKLEELIKAVEGGDQL